jgi:CubicO group peptidase (beta-lactamase class C family)
MNMVPDHHEDPREHIRTLLEEARRQGAFPGAVLLWGLASGKPSCLCSGVLRKDIPGDPVTESTLFDLASLTKPLVTASLALLAAGEGALSLSTPLGNLTPLPHGHYLENQPFSRLLSHTSGLLSWAPLYRDIPAGNPRFFRKVLEERILDLPPDYPPGTQARYSDFGYMLAGWIIERVYGGRSLDEIFMEKVTGPLSIPDTGFIRTEEASSLRMHPMASTEMLEDLGVPLTGLVHDEHARYLGGVSGHAGLFASALSVWKLVLPWMGNGKLFRPELLSDFIKKQPGVSWSCGWDSPTGNSQSGHLFSENAIGHLGYTGTSIWMEPENGRIIILLTNRVHPSRTQNLLKIARPGIYDSVMENGFD